MKILLLNENPVVNKLVTLSAQKTSDEIEIASNTEDIPSQDYDLLIVDDSVYSDDLFNEINAKIKYKKSLFICTKDAQELDSFSSILKKPFLPTDLVELFMMFEKEAASEVQEEQADEEEKIEEENITADEIEDLSDDLELDDELNLDDELDLDEDISLDDDENFGESVLDDEEVQKVKDLLDESEEELNFDDGVEQDLESLELEELGALNNEESIEEPETEEPEVEEKLSTEEQEDPLTAYDIALDLEDEADVDISEGESFDLEEEVDALEDEELEEIETATVEELEEEVDEMVSDELNAQEGDLALDLALDLEDEADVDISHDPIADLEEVNEEVTQEIEETQPEELVVSEESNLEDEIQSAVESLTQEDLESELDEDTLLQIAKNEIDPLADLTSKDLKIALGEEVDEEYEETAVEEADMPVVAEVEDTIETEEENEEQNSGVEALKKLLEALNDKEVAASMKGMKISINITLGDN